MIKSLNRGIRRWIQKQNSKQIGAFIVLVHRCMYRCIDLRVCIDVRDMCIFLQGSYLFFLLKVTIFVFFTTINFYLITNIDRQYEHFISFLLSTSYICISFVFVFNTLYINVFVSFSSKCMPIPSRVWDQSKLTVHDSIDYMYVVCTSNSVI